MAAHAGFGEDEVGHVDLLRKIEVRFKTLVEQRDMAIHFNYASDIHSKERTLKEERKVANQAEAVQKQKAEALRQTRLAAEKEEIQAQKAAIDKGRAVAQRSNKPNFRQRKETKKQKDETEIMFKKFLGYTMAEMQEAATNQKK